MGRMEAAALQTTFSQVSIRWLHMNVLVVQFCSGSGFGTCWFCLVLDFGCIWKVHDQQQVVAWHDMIGNKTYFWVLFHPPTVLRTVFPIEKTDLEHVDLGIACDEAEPVLEVRVRRHWLRTQSITETELFADAHHRRLANAHRRQRHIDANRVLSCHSHSNQYWWSSIRKTHQYSPTVENTVWSGEYKRHFLIFFSCGILQTVECKDPV